MHFTREPIVETVITPKEGFKLIIQNSSGNSSEEYSVNAIEVVSFGNSYFFRNKEKPKAFLLPLSEYEVLEVRETRTVLKKPQVEKSIKIGQESKLAAKGEPAPSLEEGEQDTTKKKERKRSRKSKGKEPIKSEKQAPQTAEQIASVEPAALPPVRRTLLPPPTSLISEQISRYKDYLVSQGAIEPEAAQGEEEKQVENLEPSANPISIEDEQREMFIQDDIAEEDKIVDMPMSDGDEER